MGFRQITRLPLASGARRTLPGSYPPALSGWPGSGRSWPIPARAWSLATPTRAGTCWLWRWRNPVARRTAQERSSPATAMCPWSSSTPTLGAGCRPPAAAGITRACIGKGMEPYDAVDPGVERARSTPGSTASYGSIPFPMHARVNPAAAGGRHPAPNVGVDEDHGHMAVAGDDRSCAVLRATGFRQRHSQHVPARVGVANDQARAGIGQLLPDPGHPLNAGG